MDALKYKNKDTIDFLIENGASANDEDFSGKSVADYAYETGSMEMIKRFGGSDEDIQKLTQNGTSSLMYASKRGDRKVLDYFLDKGLDINQANDEGYTALLEAVQGANLEATKYLIEKGANIDAITTKEQNLLILASRGEYLQTAQSQRPKVSYEMMEYIYNLTKPNINATDGIGSTALIAAAASNNTQAVKFLLDHGADITIKNDRGYTAISAAEYYNYDEVVKMIEKYSDANK